MLFLLQYFSVYFFLFFFFFNDTATTEIYTLSLHDALPISAGEPLPGVNDSTQHADIAAERGGHHAHRRGREDRKSTRLNSSHSQISYAVFCLKKKKKKQIQQSTNKKNYTLSTRYM